MFAERLKLLRSEKKITQLQLANIIKVAPSTIGMYERGSREPNIETIKTIANLFNVSSDYLIGLTDIREKTETILNNKKNEFFTNYISSEAKKEINSFLEYIKFKYKIKNAIDKF